LSGIAFGSAGVASGYIVPSCANVDSTKTIEQIKNNFLDKFLKVQDMATLILIFNSVDALCNDHCF
jgi:hypothetical protein